MQYADQAGPSIVLQPAPGSITARKLFRLHPGIGRPPWVSFGMALALVVGAVAALRTLPWPAANVPAQVLFVGLLLWVPVGVGTIFWSGLRDRRAAARRTADRSRPQAATGAGDEDWDPEFLRSHASAGLMEAAAGAWLCLVLTTAAVSWLAHEPALDSILATLFLGALTTAVCWIVVPRLVSQWRIGPCTIVLESVPLQPGRQHRLTIRSERGRGLGPAVLHLRFVSTSNTGGADMAERQIETWPATAIVPGSRHAIEFVLDLPADCPSTSIRRQQYWELELRGARHLMVEFVLPVYAAAAPA